MLGNSHDNIILQERRKRPGEAIYWRELERWPTDEERNEAFLIFRRLNRIRDLVK